MSVAGDMVLAAIEAARKGKRMSYLTKNGGGRAYDLAMFLRLQHVAARDLRLGDLVLSDTGNVFCLMAVVARENGRISLYDPLGNGEECMSGDSRVTIIARDACAGTGEMRAQHAMGDAWLPTDAERKGE